MSGIYVHIPFCHSKCAYCDFFSRPSGKGVPEEYIDTLLLEFQHRRNELPRDQSVTTIYLGGGTPSLLSPCQLEKILHAITGPAITEITMEVNPEDVTEDYARAIAAAGVNRVSMGVQTLSDRILSAIGRRHTAKQALTAVESLRKAELSNLSLDLMFGLPGQTITDWEDTLQQILSMRPEHLSAYSLMLEPGTRLYARWKAGKFGETPQEMSEQMYLTLCAEASHAGYDHYEISNFALPGFHSRHNSAYWDLTPYLGLGPGAHSFDGVTRRFNPPDLHRYLSESGAVTQKEEISEAERFDEYIMLRLRTCNGMDINQLEELFGEEAAQLTMERAARLIKRGMLEKRGTRLVIPERRWLVADSVIVDLFG